jgi:integrase
MTALRVSDVDLSRKRVDIRRAFSDVGGRLVLGTPKSSRSHRTVPLPGFLATELAGHLANKEPSALVFTTDTGTPLRLSNWKRKVFTPARQAAKLDSRLRLHDLRHTAASLMIQAGYPPKMVQEILGHASITTTLDLYGHLFPGDLDRYANLLDEAAGRARVAKQGPQDNEDPDGGATGVLTNMP